MQTVIQLKNIAIATVLVWVLVWSVWNGLSWLAVWWALQ